MFLVLVELEVNPASAAELENLLRELVAAARPEEGTVYYAVHRPQECKNAFVLYELYRDRAAWEEHLQSVIVQKALKQFEALLALPPRITLCDTVLTTGFGRGRCIA